MPFPKKKKEGKGLFKHLKKEKKGLYPKKQAKALQPDGWSEIKAELEKEFEARGIPHYCQVRLMGCWGTKEVHFAHTKKRRHITKPKYPLWDEAPEELKEAWKQYLVDMSEVIKACNPCHDVIESWGEERMGNFIREIRERTGLSIDKS